jgi:AcrR family transcriptional regulator
VDANGRGDGGSLRRTGYRRSVGTPRGEARRRELLDRVVDDLAVNGLVDFSLRRAARAAGTTHKVLLYHFDGADDLLRQAILELRGRRIANSLAAIRDVQPQTLAARVRAVWPAPVGEESRGPRAGGRGPVAEVRCLPGWHIGLAAEGVMIASAARSLSAGVLVVRAGGAGGARRGCWWCGPGLLVVRAGGAGSAGRGC